MGVRRLIGISALLCVFLLPGSASAAPTPAWGIQAVPVPTNFVPGSTGQAFYEVSVTNSGGSFTDGSHVIIADTLPAGLTVESVQLTVRSFFGREEVGPLACDVEEVGGQATVTCQIDESLPGYEPAKLSPGGAYQLIIHVSVPPSATGSLVDEARVEGGGALPKSTAATNVAGADPATPGVSYFDAAPLEADGSVTTQAGAHPEAFTTSFAVHTAPGLPGRPPFVPAGGDVRDISVDLPPGLVGNPTAVTQCSNEEFSAVRTVSISGRNIFRNDCPAGSAVGYIFVQQLEGLNSSLYLPIFELEPPKGMPAQFGFQVAGAPFLINTRIRSGGDYGVTAYLENVSQLKRITGARVTLWGVPADPRHDPYRGNCLSDVDVGPGGLSLGNCPAGLSPRPFITMPTSCEGPLLTRFSFDTWSQPGSFFGADALLPAPTGCGILDFSPALKADPQTEVADSPTGIAVNIHLPQNEDPNGLAEANLRDAVIRLPKGLTVNPAAATGLASCSPDQVGLLSPPGAAFPVFDSASARCPDAAKLGTVEVKTPLLDHPLQGGVYLASQADNPFGSLLAIYIVADDSQTGVVIKLAGEVDADKSTGQLTTTFRNNPQLPFEDLSVVMFEGPHAPLRTPATCGSYTTTSVLRPWSAPQSGPDATPSDAFAVLSSPGGGPCAASESELPNDPTFTAGTLVPLAGTYSPFTMRLSRADGTQELEALTVSLPKGLTGRLAGIPYCSAAGLAHASTNAGSAERSNPSCEPASKVGSAEVGVGAGPQPFYVDGAAYLAGPYRGAPLSLAIVTPALAGPLDLGTVVVRVALHVDPATAQITAGSDDLPTILQGIPLDIRDIRVNLDRKRFALNPTSCAPSSIDGSARSVLGNVAPLSDRFQVGGCGGLGFTPKLSLSLKGGTKRNQHPALRAVLKANKHQANLARAVVTLPASEFIDQAHISNPCTRVQFSNERCPKGSILGKARVSTPLLDKPLEGRVYFRSNGGARELPDMVLDLRGQIHLVLVGFIDSKRVSGGQTSRVRTTFKTLPDAPVSKFVLQLKGGKHGLLVNSESLCSRAPRALVKLQGHNGKSSVASSLIRTSCPSR